MECCFIFLILACVLTNTLAIGTNHSKVEKAHSEVLSYAENQMVYVPQMRSRTSYHLECYNGFLPLINSLATKARDVSNGCVITANYEKDQELQALEKVRLAVSEEVNKITKSLRDCSNLNGLDYFFCLGKNAELNKKIMQIVKVKSVELTSNYSKTLKAIDNREEKCIMNAVDTAKVETDQSFVDLKACIQNGPVIQTEVEDSEETTN